MVNKLTADERAALLAAHPSWREVAGRDAIEKTIEFQDFNEAFGFMTRIALYADKADHHPEWFNVYNRVIVTLTTHDADGVSQRDADMVEFIESALSS